MPEKTLAANVYFEVVRIAKGVLAIVFIIWFPMVMT